ncbi:MAG: tetratricopeptide repeat protein [Gammaproteobacteria bacterium]|nr:tetratricopeptide repeat protein [Gammaproteobacteria bacterium]
MTRRGIAVIASAMLMLSLSGGHVFADQSSENLESLFRELATAEYPITAQQLEREIWRTWLDSGDERVNRKLRTGISAMQGGRLEAAIQHFSEVIEMAPGFAEGWNKRATAHYLNGEFSSSMRDIQETLEREPRHFGAISGMGLIFMQQGDERAALDAFEEVLKIHPQAPGAGKHAERLRKKLKGREI